jgi:hypothetical protein
LPRGIVVLDEGIPAVEGTNLSAYRGTFQPLNSPLRLLEEFNGDLSTYLNASDPWFQTYDSSANLSSPFIDQGSQVFQVIGALQSPDFVVNENTLGNVAVMVAQFENLSSPFSLWTGAQTPFVNEVSVGEDGLVIVHSNGTSLKPNFYNVSSFGDVQNNFTILVDSGDVYIPSSPGEDGLLLDVSGGIFNDVDAEIVAISNASISVGSGTNQSATSNAYGIEITGDLIGAVSSEIVTAEGLDNRGKPTSSVSSW